MNADLARRIIRQAREDETYEGPIPEDDGKALTEAAALVQMATDAWAANVKGPEVEAILRLAAEADDEPSTNGATGDAADTAVPEPSPEPQATADPSPEQVADLAKEEPWEGYSKETVTDIVEALEIAAEQEDDWQELALHIWSYESNHKNRVRIMKALDRLAEKVKEEPGREEPAPAPQGAGEAEGAAAPEAHAGAEAGVEEGEGDGPQAEAPQPEAPAEVGATADTEPPSGKRFVTSSTEVVADLPDSYEDDEARQIAEAVLESLKRERLHVPPMIEAEEVELPFDLTTLSDKGIQRLHSAFTAYAYRIGFLYMKEDRMAATYKSMADEMVSKLIVEADKIEPQTGKPKTVGLLEAEAAMDPLVKKWRKAQRKHDSFALSYKHQRDSYLKNAETLSRQESMRHQEWERSGGGRKR